MNESASNIGGASAGFGAETSASSSACRGIGSSPEPLDHGTSPFGGGSARASPTSSEGAGVVRGITRTTGTSSTGTSTRWMIGLGVRASAAQRIEKRTKSASPAR